MPSIGIAGAGILGRVLAWRLVQAGFKVSLFDSDSKHGNQGAVWTAAGMLTPHTELEASNAVFELELSALSRWTSLAESLTGLVTLNRGGCLVVAHPQDTASLAQFNQVLQHHAARASAQAEHLDYAALKDLQPELAERFRKALWFPQEQWVNPHEVMHALATKLLEAGVEWHESSPITTLSAYTLQTPHHTYTFDCVVDTRGLGAKEAWQGFRGVRGEVIEVFAPEVELNCLVRLLHPRYALYIVPRPHHHYVIGATQIESEDSSPISVRSALELLSAAYSIHSGFAEARIVALRTNCRPTLPDHAPHLQVERGLLRANGLYRHGILLSPEIAYQLEQQLEYALC
ncbi:glycine oxidase ThiO [Thiofilum flexile]|uniref:glycine oxidase ThiO n=1 Tax=Thiofilum flexile TaxID=125627 RepID=UPI00037803CE|nr:glycine oxidase ThiO [Thiofilum flexile]